MHKVQLHLLVNADKYYAVRFDNSKVIISCCINIQVQDHYTEIYY